MIKRIRNKYVLISKSGKILGRFRTRREAEKRERQVQYFKNHYEVAELTG